MGNLFWAMSWDENSYRTSSIKTINNNHECLTVIVIIMLSSSKLDFTNCDAPCTDWELKTLNAKNLDSKDQVLLLMLNITHSDLSQTHVWILFSAKWGKNTGKNVWNRLPFSCGYWRRIFMYKCNFPDSWLIPLTCVSGWIWSSLLSVHLPYIKQLYIWSVDLISLTLKMEQTEI
jgi:hypothetical protein